MRSKRSAGSTLRFTALTALGAASFIATGCMTLSDPQNVAGTVVEGVDLSRYAGKWFEVASIPSVASANGRCTNTTAEYELQDDGTIRLLNTCFLDDFEGRRITISGSARALDGTNGRLAILFDRSFFEAAYNIIALDPDYRWAVVGAGPDGLFILGRTPVLDDATYQFILSLLPDLGYDPADLLLTPQDPSRS